LELADLHTTHHHTLRRTRTRPAMLRRLHAVSHQQHPTHVDAQAAGHHQRNLDHSSPSFGSVLISMLGAGTGAQSAGAPGAPPEPPSARVETNPGAPPSGETVALTGDTGRALGETPAASNLPNSTATSSSCSAKWMSSFRVAYSHTFGLCKQIWRRPSSRAGVAVNRGDKSAAAIVTPKSITTPPPGTYATLRPRQAPSGSRRCTRRTHRSPQREEIGRAHV